MAKPLKNIGRPKSLYMEAMQSIKESLFKGDFTPGETLPSEMELSTQLGVSRPVIREALRGLQIQGFLDIRRGNQGGTFVKDLDSISFQDNLEDLIRLRRVSIADLTQARFLIEPEVFKLAAKNITEKQLVELEQMVEKTAQTQDPDQHQRLGVDFHRLVAKACGNLFYALLMDTIMDFLDKYLHTINPTRVDIHGEEGHREIYETLRTRNGKKAAALLEKHITNVSHSMLDLEKAWRRTRGKKK